jgi:hypothetical protein
MKQMILNIDEMGFVAGVGLGVGVGEGVLSNQE